MYQQDEEEATRLVKKQRTHMLLHGDVDQVAVENKSSDSRKPDSGNKNFRKKTVKSEDEDDKA